MILERGSRLSKPPSHRAEPFIQEEGAPRSTLNRKLTDKAIHTSKVPDVSPVAQPIPGSDADEAIPTSKVPNVSPVVQTIPGSAAGKTDGSSNSAPKPPNSKHLAGKNESTSASPL